MRQLALLPPAKIAAILRRRVYERRYYREKAKGQRRAYERAARAQDPEKRRSADRARYWANPEQVRAKRRAYYHQRKAA